jgi:N,N'-diacetyllegionaminate synthase
MRLGTKQVGDAHPCFITFEAGPTHSGLESAKRLVKLSADAGADAVKFQIFKPDNLVADRAMLYTYHVLADRASGRTEEVSEPLYDIFVRRHLENDEWVELKRYSDSLGLAFFATIGDDDGLELVQALGCHSIKIASADVNHHPLIRKVARTALAVQLDTGNATFGEIETAVDLIRAEGNENIIIHNCPTGYPARLDSINLRMIPALKQTFGCAVAYSDHTPGWDMDIAAIALGANLVEKTITEDRCTRSVEHIMSLEPPDMRAFVRAIRDVETAMGGTRRILTDEEKRKRIAVRRSVYLARAVQARTALRDAEVVFKRPGHGLAPDSYERLLDYVFREPLAAGTCVEPHHIVPPEG